MSGLVNLLTDQRNPLKGSLAPCLVAAWSPGGSLETPPRWHVTIIRSNIVRGQLWPWTGSVMVLIDPWGSKVNDSRMTYMMTYFLSRSSSLTFGQGQWPFCTHFLPLYWVSCRGHSVQHFLKQWITPALGILLICFQTQIINFPRCGWQTNNNNCAVPGCWVFWITPYTSWKQLTAQQISSQSCML